VKLRSLLVTVVAIFSLLAPAAASAKPTHKRHLPRHLGGHVHHAWPSRHGRNRPSRPLARWLARQVGPVKVHHRRTRRHRAQALARATSTAGSVPFQNTGATGSLSLVRSYAIPPDDPSAARLANLSWTYDSAVAAIAFTETGNSGQAQQLLDQLQALQRSDGSIDFAFNVSNGQSIPQFRTGTVAWAGLAAADYRANTCSTRYDPLAYGAAKWLLTQQDTSQTDAGYGLLVGGPDVSWSSTQHNLVARAFFARLADAIDLKLTSGKGKCSGGLTGLTSTQATTFSTQLRAAVTLIDAGINRQLYVRLTPATTGRSATAGTAYFREGVNDDVRPVDAQALGAAWLLGLGRDQDAQAVLNYTDQSMLVTGRSVTKSSDPATYNQTYSGTGPYTGYRPYADSSSPNVLWIEGTLEMVFAKNELGLDTSSLDASVTSWQAITGSFAGPLQADRTVTGNVFNEYHPWPDAAGGAWELLNLSSFSLLSGS